MGAVITHFFEDCATVADMKRYLLHAHHAYDPDSQVLAMVWEEQILKLTNDAQTVATLGVVQRDRQHCQKARGGRRCSCASSLH
jgi:hypothetical protein